MIDKAKRSAQIGVRITPETKELLTFEANKLDWTVSQLAEKILTSWIQNLDSNGGALTFVQPD